MTRTEYRGIELVDMPSGMGGKLPAAVAMDEGEALQVLCIHPDYFNNFLMTVPRSQCEPCSYRLTRDMMRLIDQRIINKGRRKA